MKPIDLSTYLHQINTKSKVNSLLGERGGYIIFNNTSDKYFTLGLDSIITSFKDILKKIEKFQTILKYDETKWRDLAAANFTDSAANAMSTVQSMGMYNAMSKLIFAANGFDYNNFKDGNINFDKDSLEKAIQELEELAKQYEPKKTVNKSIIILEKQKLKWIIFNTFKLLLKTNDEKTLLDGYSIKESKINDTIYDGLFLPQYFGTDNLIGIFKTEQTKNDLKSSNTERYFEERIKILESDFAYFTTQWGDTDGKYKTLINFNKYLSDKSANTLEIIKDGSLFTLISKGNDNTSPLKKTEQIIYYGAPGTGKSYKVEQTLKEVDSHFYERITFHPEFDNASFIGSYRPKSDNGKINYEFVPQSFTNIYVKAWNDTVNQYYIAIEEINRGNCAEIFGDIFQLLDRNSNYTVSPSDEMKNHIIKEIGEEHEGIKNGLKLPPNLSIFATMNTSDQSLFPMDSAFKRRWDWEYIPICYDDVSENESFGYHVNIEGSTFFKWIDFIKNVNAVIKTNPNLGMDKCIGNYFIKSDSKEITLKEFVNKAIFYLWNDVFKDEDSSDSIFEKDVSYEDFFPIHINGKNEVVKILEALKIGTFVKAKI